MSAGDRPGWPYDKEFLCHRCGNCCRGDGVVELTSADIEGAAHLLGLSTAEFEARYCRFGEGIDSLVLIDQRDLLKSCVFLQSDNTCRIHAAKPQQCRGFPFLWRPSDVLEFCEGMRALEGLPPPVRRTITDR